MAVTKVGETGIGFGVTSAADAATTACVTGYSQTENQEVKELRGRDGNVVAAVFHKRKQDITIDFVGAPGVAVNVGSNLHGSGYEGSDAEEILIDEVTTDISAEGHRTTSVKCTGYFTTA